jgi:glycosyl hydrolase family 99/fibronectin type III domain protein
VASSRRRRTGSSRLRPLLLLAILCIALDDVTNGVAASSVTVTPVADSYVRSDAAGSNYGRSAKLYVDGSPVVRSYLRFSVSGLAGAVTKATLRVFAGSGLGSGFDVYGVASTAWSETGITYANVPPLAASKTASSGAVAAGAWTAVDVTPLITGDGVYSFALTTTNSKSLGLASRESGATAPQLVVEAPDLEAPTAPANLHVEASTQTSVTIVWGAATDNVGVTGYRLYRGGTQVGTTPATRFTFDGLTADTGYTFAVAAYDAAGNSSGRARVQAKTAGLSFPIRAAFYYPWFPAAWNQQGYRCGSSPPSGSPATPSGCFTDYYPTLGFYDPDRDPTVYDRQIQAMRYGGIQAAISSWWGVGDDTDTHFSTMLARADALGTGFKLAIYYEPEGSGNPSVGTIQSQLAYLTGHYTGNPAYLRVGGKPVIFVYNADLQQDQTCATVDKWKQAVGSAWYVVLKIFPGALSCAWQPDAWHQYAPAQAVEHQTGWGSYAISPGFSKANETTPRLPRDLTRWRQNVRDMVASNEPWQLVVSFNEWGEGTSVESATAQTGPFGTAGGWASPSGYGGYLDVLHSNGNQ